jgi:hypothetical protein
MVKASLIQAPPSPAEAGRYLLDPGQDVIQQVSRAAFGTTNALYPALSGWALATPGCRRQTIAL